MAQRRMFSPQITESDAFIEMPLSSQALYFHLCMNADDDGFIKNPKSIQRLVGGKDKDYKTLADKRFIFCFPSGVSVIKHWRMHNLLRKDRYKETVYVDEKATLYLKPDGAYTFDESQGVPVPKYAEEDSGKDDNSPSTDRQPHGNQQATTSAMATDWQPNDNQMAPQVRLGKERVSYNEESKKEEIYNNPSSAGARESYEVLMTRCGVGPQLRSAIWQFIRHCALNGKKLTNDKLEDVICRLQDYYGYAEYGERWDEEQAKEIYRAINGGYFDIKVGRK